MIRFRDLPIRRKLLLMTLTSTAAALVFASGGFLWWDIERLRSDVLTDMKAQSIIIAEISGAALTFGDDRVAAKILAALTVRVTAAPSRAGGRSPARCRAATLRVSAF